MWKNNCSVLRNDTAHRNCGRQQVDMVHLPSGTLYIFYAQITFFTYRNNSGPEQNIYKCTLIKQAVGHLVVI